MISGRLTEITKVLRAELIGSDGSFLGISTDSRNIEAGQLFVALRGPRFDGHKFLAEAASCGACAALVDTVSELPMPQVRVPDTLRALGDLAVDWRARFDLPVIGVTGSFGKTTVKEMLARILGQGRSTLVTRGNLNNEIGVPLTLFGLSPRDQCAVIEMGANHAGEIARLCAIASPDIGLVTVAGACHLEGFGSLEGVARAKGEMFQALPAEGVAVINADDSFAGLWRQFAGARPVSTFGLGPAADYTAREIRRVADDELRFLLVCPEGEAPVRLPLAGRHNVVNALAAAASGIRAGASLEQVVAGLESMVPVAGRMQLLRTHAGGRLIDDSYNASPRTVRAGLDYLCELQGRPWAALGDMGELGESGPELHSEIGHYARSIGIERLFVLGPLSEHTAAAFGAGALHFFDTANLSMALSEALDADVNVLVKGSRMMRMENVVQALTGPTLARAGGGL